MYMGSVYGHAGPACERPQSYLNGLPLHRYRHPKYERTNVCYFDGHVETETYDWIFNETMDVDRYWLIMHPFWSINY